jgi:hypothetical protein
LSRLPVGWCQMTNEGEELDVSQKLAAMPIKECANELAFLLELSSEQRRALRLALARAVREVIEGATDLHTDYDASRPKMLKSELAVSEISGKPYRIDQQVRSGASGKVGHRQEAARAARSNSVLSVARFRLG